MIESHVTVTLTYRVVTERDPVDGGFVAECPDLPGCMSQGATPEEAAENIRHAITEWLCAVSRP